MTGPPAMVLALLAAVALTGCALPSPGTGGAAARARPAFEQRGAVFDVHGMAPGDRTTRCLTAVNAGSGTARRAGLWVVATGALAPALDLEIVRGASSRSADAAGACDGFTAEAGPALYAGPLDRAPASVAAPLVDASRPWASGARRAYRVTVELSGRPAPAGAGAGVDVHLAAEDAPAGASVPRPGTCTGLARRARLVVRRRLGPGLRVRLTVAERRGGLVADVEVGGSLGRSVRRVVLRAGPRTAHRARRPFRIVLPRARVHGGSLTVVAALRAPGGAPRRLTVRVGLAPGASGRCIVRARSVHGTQLIARIGR